MSMIKILQYFFYAAFISFAASSHAEEELALIKDGSPYAAIVIGKPATKAAQFAAFELQWHLEQMSGAKLPIVTADQKTEGVRILVGDSDATKELGLKSDDFKPQEYLVGFRPGTLILFGNDKPDTGEVKYERGLLTADLPSSSEDTELAGDVKHERIIPNAYETWPDFWGSQGTLYAAYDFLEKHCGVRWFNPSETGTLIPRRKDLIVRGSEERRRPFFSTRCEFGGNVNADYDAVNCMWTGEKYKEYEAAAFPELHRKIADGAQYMLAKRSVNSLFLLRMRAGGEKCLCNHSLYGYYDRFWAPCKGSSEHKKNFEKKRPELFAKGYEKEDPPPQMCYSSRELVEQVASDAKEYFDNGGYQYPVCGIVPGLQWGSDYFAVEPMDNGSFCKCENCRKWLGADNPAADAPHQYGKFSSYKFNFVNEVAKLVAETNPGKKIITLAYGSTMACPKGVKLEPNVVLDFCFDANRLVYDRSPYQYEAGCLRDWVENYPGREFQLWLYDTFPNEIANNGKWHAFPGYFAHAAGEQFRLFKELGIKGIFHCGYGQEVEAYVTFKLMDNPDLGVDLLLDEYFGGVYGGAGARMKEFYLEVEKTYCDPANYPPYVRKNTGYDHQTEEIAWGWLGDGRRMRRLAEIFEKAKAAADTGRAKRNVELFEKGTWSYMLEGRRKYLEGVRQKFGGRIHMKRIPFAPAKSAGGGSSGNGWSEALALSEWRTPLGEPSAIDAKVQLLVDGKVLRVRFSETADTAVPVCRRWEIAFAARRGDPCRILRIAPEGVSGLCKSVDGSSTGWNSGAESRWAAGGGEAVLAIPLDRLGKDGAAPGVLFMNFRRVSEGDGGDLVYVPGGAGFDLPASLAEFSIDGPDSIPAEIPDSESWRKTAAGSLIGLWEMEKFSAGVVPDSSGHSLDGRLINGPALKRENDPKGSFRLDDEQSQYLEIGDPPSVALQAPFSLTIRFRYEPTRTYYPALMGKGYGDGKDGEHKNDTGGGYSLHLRPDFSVWFELDAADGSRKIYNPTERPVSPGEWTHVAATYDGKIMRAFVNGREAGKGLPAADIALRKTSQPFRIGWLGSYGWFNGCVDAAAIHGRALTPAEVFADYLSRRAGEPSPAH